MTAIATRMAWSATQWYIFAMAHTTCHIRMKEPSFKMILTAVGKYAYRREDGIYIVPIGCLKD